MGSSQCSHRQFCIFSLHAAFKTVQINGAEGSRRRIKGMLGRSLSEGKWMAAVDERMANTGGPPPIDNKRNTFTETVALAALERENELRGSLPTELRGVRVFFLPLRDCRVTTAGGSY